jgi:hypothetical protein
MKGKSYTAHWRDLETQQERKKAFAQGLNGGKRSRRTPRGRLARKNAKNVFLLVVYYSSFYRQQITLKNNNIGRTNLRFNMFASLNRVMFT